MMKAWIQVWQWQVYSRKCFVLRSVVDVVLVMVMAMEMVIVLVTALVETVEVDD